MKNSVIHLMLALASLPLAASLNAQTTVNLVATDDQAAETWAGQTPNPGAIRIARSGSTASALVVWLKVSGTAVRGSDYSLGASVGNSVTIPAGSAHVDVPVVVLDDRLPEVKEAVRVDLEDETPSGTAVPYQIGNDDRAEIDLFDNESLAPPPMVSVAGLNSGSEGLGGSPVAGVFRVTRDGDASVAITVAYQMRGTATAGADYAALPGSVVIPAGSRVADIVVSPVDDAELEGDETVTLVLLPSTCAGTHPPAADCYAFGPTVTADVTLSDNEIPPVRAVVDVAVLNHAAEDEAGRPAPGAFRISRSQNLAVALSVAYSVGGAATPAVDYIPLSGQVDIPAGVASVDVIVTPVDDEVLEVGESVVLMILPPSCPEAFPPSSCYIAGQSPSASVSILDDEIAPVVSVTGWQNTNVAGLPAAGFGAFNAHSTNGHIVSYQVRVDGALRFTGVTDYARPPAPGTPLALDFAITNLSAGTHRIQAVVTDNLGNSGSASNTFSVAVIQPPPPTIQFLAIDDDAAETVPGEPANPGRFRFILTGSPDLGFSFLSFKGLAREGADYTIAYEPAVLSTNGITNIWSQDIVITPVDDAITEGTETVQIQLCFVIIAWIYGVGAPIGVECTDGTAGLYAVINVRDNDTVSPLPIVRVTAGDTDAQEVSTLSGEPQNPGAFVLTRTLPATNDLAVHYRLGGTALNGIDYVTAAGLTIISNGTTSATVPVNPIFDPLIEGSETVTLTLLPAAGAPFYLLDPGVDNSATVVLRDYAPTNIPVVRIRATDSQAIEQPSTSPYAAFRIERSGSLAAELALPYDISGTAINGRDYVALPGSVTIPVGVSHATITVIPYLDGETNEPDETVVLTLPLPDPEVFPPRYLLGGAGPLAASAGATIREDAPPRGPIDRFERARRLRFPGRYRIVPLPVLPVAEPAPAAAARGWVVEASSELMSWEAIGETEDPEEFVDVDAGDRPQRFYRFRELAPAP